MPVSEENKCVFVHVPKTAGTSIEKALGIYKKRQSLHGPAPRRGYMQHWTAEEISKYIKEEKYKSYFSFAFIRNPWDRAVSEYFYLQKIKDPFAYGLSFEKFLFKIPTSRFGLPPYIWQHIRPQIDYIKIAGQEGYAVNFLGKFEELDFCWEKICGVLKIESKLEKTQSTRHDNYKKYYKNNTIDRIRELYEKDINIFKYEF